MHEPTYVSTFAGIEGIGLGLERAGFRCVAQVEIDKFCNRVRSKRFPGVAQFGDIRDFGNAALNIAAGVEQPVRVDLLTGGFPCQDISIAGKRAGLAGARSGLFYEFVRVAREIQPTWVLVENVPGLLSSNNGRDLAVVLAELGDAGYFVEGRVLDSRWFGVPQRRRRLFLVGHLGGPSASPVLFELEGSRGNPAAGDTAGKDIAGTLGGGAPGARGYRNDLDSNGAYVVNEPMTFQPRYYADRTLGRAKGSGGAPHPLAATVTEKGDSDAGQHVLVESVALRGRTGGAAAELGGNQSHALRASRGGGDKAHVLAYRKSARMNADPQPGDVGALHKKQTPALLTMREGKDGGGKGPLVSEDQSLTLATGNGQTLFASSVRRLTPTECERLQGFPDGWTCLCDTDVCTCPDGPRYAALGNAVTVNVAEWIGHRIRMSEQ